MTHGPKLTPEERLKTLLVWLTASLARLTPFDPSPSAKKAMAAGFRQPATPPNPTANPLLALAMLAVDMEEYERRLLRADNAS
jgi:hypothetical protein